MRKFVNYIISMLFFSISKRSDTADEYKYKYDMFSIETKYVMHIAVTKLIIAKYIINPFVICTLSPLCIPFTYEIYVNAQSQAVGFYEKMGFVVTSEEFLEEGIPHKAMRYTAKNEER